MKRRTKERGITLISLMVTIIVLFIISGISIAMVIRDMGVLKNANLSKYNSVKQTAREQVELVCSAIRIVVAEASAKDNSYSAKENSDLIQQKMIETLNLDKTHLLGKFDDGEMPVSRNQSEFIIEYVGEDFKNVKIIFTIELSQKTIEIIKEEVVDINTQEIINENSIDKNINIIKDMYTDANMKSMIIYLIIFLICLIVILCIIIIILTNSINIKEKMSRVALIKQKARKKVKSACDTIKVSKIKINNSLVNESVDLVKDILLEKINNNTRDLDGNFVTEKNNINDNKNIITIFYQSEEYKKVCNNKKAIIEYAIVLEDDRLNLIKENSTIISEK